VADQIADLRSIVDDLSAKVDRLLAEREEPS
jgi:hypothetical protein